MTVSDESSVIPEAEGGAHQDIKIKVLLAEKESNELYVPHWTKRHAIKIWTEIAKRAELL